MDRVLERLEAKHHMVLVHTFVHNLLNRGLTMYQTMDVEQLTDAIFAWAYHWDDKSDAMFTLFGPHFEMLDDIAWLAMYMDEVNGQKFVNKKFLVRIGEAMITDQQLANLIEVCRKYGNKKIAILDILEWIAFMNGEHIIEEDALIPVSLPPTERGFVISIDKRAITPSIIGDGSDVSLSYPQIKHEDEDEDGAGAGTDIPIPHTLDEYLECIQRIRRLVVFVNIPGKTFDVDVSFRHAGYNLIKDKFIAAYMMHTHKYTKDHNKAIRYLEDFIMKAQTLDAFLNALTKLNKRIEDALYALPTDFAVAEQFGWFLRLKDTFPDD